ncbi:MAG TPA: MarR family transcriptional regulator, partial [Bryobacteraceae bacterium]|nr:MarR family transcriptional regulator [Bryobacteraceae bacterium]
WWQSNGCKNMADTETTTAVRAWLLLWKATKSVGAHAQRSIQLMDMCPSDFAVLELLLHKGPQPVNTLGKRVLLTSGSMTAAVDRLEERGLVQRHDDPEDRRARVVHLTSSGRKVIERLFAEHEKDMERAVSALTQQELNQLARILRKLGRSAEDLLKQELEPARLPKTKKS